MKFCELHSQKQLGYIRPNAECLILQLPEGIAYFPSNNVIKRMIHWQSILHFSGFLIKFQSFLANGVLGMS